VFTSETIYLQVPTSSQGLSSEAIQQYYFQGPISNNLSHIAFKKSDKMAEEMTEIPTSILCIEPDSGFRCLLSLLILDDLLARVSRAMSLPRRLPMRHVFDLIGGEGSGGIVALLVGRLGLSRASAPGLLQQMMPRFCPWGGIERKSDGTHSRHPFMSGLTQPTFSRLDAEAVPRGESTFFNRDCVKTCVLANLKGMPQTRSFSQRLKDWVKSIKMKARILPIK
jgi:hypothetical protein